jgi:hypothetical protein
MVTKGIPWFGKSFAVSTLLRGRLGDFYDPLQLGAAALMGFQLLDLPLYFSGKILKVLAGDPIRKLPRQPAAPFEPEFQFLFFALLLIHGRAP